MNKKNPKYPRGTKVVLEVAEIHTHYDDNGTAFNMYRMKGFRSLCLDDNGMDIAMKVESAKHEIKSDIEEWLDEIIALQDIYSKVARKHIDDGIDICDGGFSEWVQIYKGIDKIAEILGVALDSRVVHYDSGDMDIEFYFMYKGRKILQLGGKK